MVELVVVVAIVGILLSLAVVGFRSTRENGQHAAVRSAMVEYADAAQQFALEHDGRMPRPDTADWPGGAAWLAGPVRHELRTEPVPYAPSLVRMRAIEQGLLVASGTGGGGRPVSPVTWRLDAELVAADELVLRAVPLTGSSWSCEVRVVRDAESEVSC
jgi:type II secretory pathway pseudopilin PulG